MSTSLKWQEGKDKHKSSSNSANKASSKPNKPVIQKVTDNNSGDASNFYVYENFHSAIWNATRTCLLHKKFDAMIDDGCSESEFGSSANAIELIQYLETIKNIPNTYE